MKDKKLFQGERVPDRDGVSFGKNHRKIREKRRIMR